MGRQLIVFCVVTALAVFHAAADEVEPSETPEPVQEVSPGAADELESSEDQESIHETQPGEAASEADATDTKRVQSCTRNRAVRQVTADGRSRRGEVKQARVRV